MKQSDVLKLQLAINAETGWGLTEDGIYGPKTAEAYQYYLNQQTPHNVPTPVPAGVKPWYLSRAVLGILATAIAGLAGRLDYVIEAGALTDALLQVVEVGGLVVAFIGTIRRRAPIDSFLVAPGLRIPTRADPLPPDGPADRATGPFGH